MSIVETLSRLGAETDELAKQRASLDRRRKKAAANAYQKGLSRTEICKQLRISEPTLSAWLKEQDVPMARR
ncbi:helix-turn-helix domain-containing protein [Gordonia bronchialis]|uniref:helix-turn-helix domain-containing protein n=1 Tax=Gordonia bronchialis TaxID=2054 RepID=UPI001CC10711